MLTLPQEDELTSRTEILLQANANKVLNLLTQYSQSSGLSSSYAAAPCGALTQAVVSAAKSSSLLDSITAWIREVPLSDIVDSPLIDTVFNAVLDDVSFDAAVECLSSILRETRDIDECGPMIIKLYPKVMALQPQIAQAAEEEDGEKLKGITRIFAEAGELWALMIARESSKFRPLVEANVECCARDQEKDAISLTFNLWYELKQYLTLEVYIEARAQLADLFSSLVDIMIRHLQYPKPEGADERDLFSGDREQEEKFREFRHQMGDVLKDCCEVIGVTDCLRKSYDLITAWCEKHAPLSDNNVPDWQALEAPLFSMRAMGRMVSPEEGIMLPALIPLITEIPDHDKVRFQAVMALGRYTEWTSQHPETLEKQLNYIMAAFNHRDLEVVRAAALSFQFFCTDCADLLKGYIQQLQPLYENLLDKLPPASQGEVTEGVAAIIARQPLQNLYAAFKMYCDPVVDRLKRQAQSASSEPEKLALADRLNLIVIFVQQIQPYVDPSQGNPAVQYCQEIFPVLATIQQAFLGFTPILERVCRCWRYMVLSYRSAMAPVLPQLAEHLATGFTATRQGGFLWATDSIVREFSEGAEHVDPSISNAIFQFCEQQTTTFLHALSELTPVELPDGKIYLLSLLEGVLTSSVVVEDFFRLSCDVLLYYPERFVSSALVKDVVAAASASLTLLKEEPLLATLRFLRDLLAYGGEDSPQSSYGPGGQASNSSAMQNAVQHLLLSVGEDVTQRVMTGMMYSFPRDCFPDASGVLLALLQVLPREASSWVGNTLKLVPEGSITPQEAQRLMHSIEEYFPLHPSADDVCSDSGRRQLGKGEMRKVRVLLQDFTNSYRRRNVAPREGLGLLEAQRFRFAG